MVHPCSWYGSLRVHWQGIPISFKASSEGAQTGQRCCGLADNTGNVFGSMSAAPSSVTADEYDHSYNDRATDRCWGGDNDGVHMGSWGFLCSDLAALRVGHAVWRGAGQLNSLGCDCRSTMKSTPPWNITCNKTWTLSRTKSPSAFRFAMQTLLWKICLPPQNFCFEYNEIRPVLFGVKSFYPRLF